MNANLLSIVSIIIAIAAVIVASAFAVMYLGSKSKQRRLRESLGRLTKELENFENLAHFVSDKEPDDKRPNTAVMKLQNELSKYIVRRDGVVGIWVLGPHPSEIDFRTGAKVE